MDRRSFLSTSLGAVLTAGMPDPEPAAWKVFYLNRDYIAARSRIEAQAWYFEWCGQLVQLADIEPHAIERFEGSSFDAGGFHIPADNTPIAPWIRDTIAADPQIPCYLFSADDCDR